MNTTPLPAAAADSQKDFNSPVKGCAGLAVRDPNTWTCGDMGIAGAKAQSDCMMTAADFWASLMYLVCFIP